MPSHTYHLSCAMMRLESAAVLLSGAAPSGGSSHSAAENSGSFCSSMVARRCCMGMMCNSSLTKLSPVAYFKLSCRHDRRGFLSA